MTTVCAYRKLEQNKFVNLKSASAQYPRRAPPPLSGTRGSSPPVTGGSTASRRALAAELGDPMSQSGYLTARRFLMDDPGTGRPHQSGFGCHQSRPRGGLIAACDRIFN